MSNWVTFLQKCIVPQFFFLLSLFQCFQSPFLLNPFGNSYLFYFPIFTPYFCNNIRRPTGNAWAIYQAEVFSSPFYLADLCQPMLYGLPLLQRYNHAHRRRQSKTQVPLNCTAGVNLFPTVSSSPASIGQEHLCSSTGQVQKTR